MSKFNNGFAGLGIGINHHFGGGVYAKETIIPAGRILSQHKHNFDHLSILASGTVEVIADGAANIYVAPCCITIAANTEHQVSSISDVVWYCIHATDCTDAGLIDHELINE